MHAVYSPTSSDNKWNTQFKSKSPKTCKFKSCLKIEISNSQWWQCSSFHPSLCFTKTFSLKSSTTHQNFEVLMFCITFKCVVAIYPFLGLGLFWSTINYGLTTMWKYNVRLQLSNMTPPLTQAICSKQKCPSYTFSRLKLAQVLQFSWER